PRALSRDPCALHLPPHGARPARAPPSFPTRRSSDLSWCRDKDPSASSGEAIRHSLFFRFSRGKVRSSYRGGTPRLSEMIQTCRKDRKSTRLNSSHVKISYAVFCLKKKREEHLRQ